MHKVVGTLQFEVYSSSPFARNGFTSLTIGFTIQVEKLLVQVEIMVVNIRIIRWLKNWLKGK